MRTGGLIQGVTLTLIIAVLALVFSACEGRRKLPSVVGYQLSNNTESPTNNPNAKPVPLRLDDALAQLDALAKPESVDAALWGHLTSAFRTALSARGEKITAAAPSSESSRVSDLAFSDDGAGNLVLKWHYRNMGDYDQNGMVGIPDVTPIAMYYGYSYSPADVNSVLAVIDGSGNGVVDIADITPLAMNFGAQCAEYALEDAAGEAGNFAEVARIPLPDAGNGERIALSTTHVLDPARPFVRVVPYDSAGVPGIPSTPLNIAGAKPHITSVYPWFAVTGTEQQFISYADGDAPLYYSWDFGGGAEPNTSSERLPTVTIGAPGAYNAKLTVSNIFGSEECAFTLTTSGPPEITGVTPNEGDFSTETTFTAYLTGTGPFTYSWDFGGGATPNTSTEANPNVTLGAMGDYVMSLTVSSFYGTDTYQFNLHVLTWHVELVDDEASTTKTASLALDANGLPHVAYTFQEPYNGHLKYAYNDGTIWHVETVDEDGLTGLNPSLALDSMGWPHVSYYSFMGAGSNPTHDLQYASYDGSSWLIETVDSEGDAGDSSSLALDSLDLPRIAYSRTLESGPIHLMYARNDGSAWNIETADSQDNVGRDCSLALDSLERPRICYLDEAASYFKLKYTYDDGAGWQVETVEDDPGAVYNGITLALDSLGLPHFSNYYSQGGLTDEIEYRYYDGLEWNRKVLDYTNRVGDPSLALDSLDRPDIAFANISANALQFTRWDGVKWLTQTVDATGGEGPSLALDAQNRPRVCYFKDGSLYYAAYY